MKSNERAGYYKNNLTGDASYESFVPSKLPPSIEISKELSTLIAKTYVSLSKLNEYSKLIPNIDFFISSYVRKEALLSSQIEGTQATLEDILDPNIKENANLNVDDVVNYVKAVNYALNRLNDLPICNRLIKEVHSVLLSGVRGSDKNPGEFRNSQNWIGGSNSTINTAKFVPPNVENMNTAINELEKFINEEDEIDSLIKISLIHYQFETIHPFLDGNGRIGRLLILLFLISKGILDKPSLYISYYLKSNQVEYYDRMSEVRRSGNYEQWISFLIQGIYETSEDASKTILLLNSLHSTNLEKINSFDISIRSKETMLKIFNYIERSPIINLMITAKDLSLSFNTVSLAVNRLCELGILVKDNNRNRNRTFSYIGYIDLIRSGT